MNEIPDKGISRRDFLKLSASGALGLVLSELGVDSALAKENSPKIVNGVEVYGLEGSVRNKEEMLQLVERLDKKFLKENDPLGVEAALFNFDELRDRLLPKEKRYLTVVVKESVYKEYLEKQEETGVDYVDWVSEHIDLMNRVFRNSQVPTMVSVELRRIIVVSDDMENPIAQHPIDTDGIWFETEDYRDKRFGDDPGYFWHYMEQEDGSILFDETTSHLGGNYSDPVVFEDMARDSLNRRKEGWLDVGFPHELTHLLNVPDSYTFDVFNGFREVGFRFNTWYFLKPEMDPYMAMIMNENIKRRIRGYFSDPDGMANKEENMYFYDLVPEKIEFKIDDCEGFSLSEAWYKRAKGEASMKDQYNFDRLVNTYENSIATGGDVFENVNEFFGKRQMEGEKEHYPLTYLIKTDAGDGERSLFFPRALLNMVYMAGKKDEAVFDIKMTGFFDLSLMSGRVQALEFVKRGDFEEQMSKKAEEMIPVVATMELPGTDLVCVWSYVER